MLEMGIIVGLGLLAMFWKLGWKGRMRVLSNPLGMDIGIFLILTLIHWGTFSGVMVAAVGALFCSITLSIGRWIFGHVEKGQYHRGVIDVGDRL